MLYPSLQLGTFNPFSQESNLQHICIVSLGILKAFQLGSSAGGSGQSKGTWVEIGTNSKIDFKGRHHYNAL